MILTKDNLLRYVREQGSVLPADVASSFETTTMIASAALSELAKEKLVGITHLKLSSSPYYYDIRNLEHLQTLAEKHFSQYDKEAYELLKSKQVVPENALSIQLRLAMVRIADFAVKLSFEHDSKPYVFWVWYLRDLGDTKKQIVEALSPQTKSATPKTVKSPKPEKKEETKIQNPVKKVVEEIEVKPNEETISQSGEEMAIEKYFKEHYLRVVSKHEEKKGISYTVSLTIKKMEVTMHCFYYFKRPSEIDIIKFYSQSLCPNIVFVSNPSKKLIKLSEEFENLTVVPL